MPMRKSAIRKSLKGMEPARTIDLDEMFDEYEICSLQTPLNQQASVSVLRSVEAQSIRQAFPILVTHPNVLFFDNAATSQKPKSVIDTITDFYQNGCSNSGRASYSWSTRLSRKVEESRAAVANLINADPDDIAFTSGATDSLNLVATSWGFNNLNDGDEVMLCLDDHKSATLPWFNVQKMLRRFNVNIKVVTFKRNSNGAYDRNSIKDGLSNRTRLISLSHIHHLYGIKMDLPEPKEIIPEQVLISLDASQSIGHTEVNVKKLGIHFVSFSGHKVFAANGTGILWVHPVLRKQIWPSRVGGKSAVEITSDGSGSRSGFGPATDLELDRSSLAAMIECGTLNLPSIISYIPAIEFIESLGLAIIENRLSALTRHLFDRLKKLPGIEFAPGFGRCAQANGFGIIAFRLTNLESADLAAYLDSQNIFVRSGDQCLASVDRQEDFVRISLHVYNTTEELDRLAEVILSI